MKYANFTIQRKRENLEVQDDRMDARNMRNIIFDLISFSDIYIYILSQLELLWSDV